MNDDIVARVTAAVQRDRAGEQADARRELNAMWAEAERGDDDFHRCLIAHFPADLQDDVSVADDHRRLGDADRAHEFLAEARATADALGDDAYGELVRGALDAVDRALAEGSTAPLPTP